MRHAGRVAMVTGAAQGIGLAIARELARGGARIGLVDTQTDRLAEAAAQVRADGGEGLALVGDVASEADVARLVRALLDRWARVDILVNNAGISPKHEGKKLPVERIELPEWDRVLAVNLTGTFLCCRATLPGMRANRWGRIVSIASQAARTASVIAGAHYAASKAGIMGFSRILATEVAPHGITVNCIAPGRIATAMAEVTQEMNDRYRAEIPVGRLGEPRDVASMVSYLASEESSFITGAILDVNGGRFMP